jgi:hypothetical protein
MFFAWNQSAIFRLGQGGCAHRKRPFMGCDANVILDVGNRTRPFISNVRLNAHCNRCNHVPDEQRTKKPLEKPAVFVFNGFALV